MFCQECGKQLHDSDVKCPACGSEIIRVTDISSSQSQNTPIQISQPQPYITSPLFYPVQPAVAPYSGLCIAGFVLSFIIPLIGLILSIVGISECSKTGKTGKGLGIAGIIISSLRAIAGFIYIVLLILYIGTEYSLSLF